MAPREPTFGEIAAALAWQVEYLGGAEALAVPLMAGLPEPSAGLDWALADFRRHITLLHKAEELIAAMAPREAEHRALLAA